MSNGKSTFPHKVRENLQKTARIPSKPEGICENLQRNYRNITLGPSGSTGGSLWDPWRSHRIRLAPIGIITGSQWTPSGSPGSRNGSMGTPAGKWRTDGARQVRKWIRGNVPARAFIRVANSPANESGGPNTVCSKHR